MFDEVGQQSFVWIMYYNCQFEGFFFSGIDVYYVIWYLNKYMLFKFQFILYCFWLDNYIYVVDWDFCVVFNFFLGSIVYQIKMLQYEDKFGMIFKFMFV